MEPPADHKKRIQQELKAAGMSSYGGMKFATNYLPKVIHDQEHIVAAIYGRYKEAEAGLFSFSSGMLVATDMRIIFLDHKLGFTSMDELTYEVVAGVRVSKAGIGSSVTLHARIAEYTIRFANVSGIDRFVQYIETRRLDTTDSAASKAPPTIPVAPIRPTSVLDEPTITFLRKNDLAVLSTIDRTGNVHGAAIYYRIDSNNYLYMITKASTQKARNIFLNQQVALTVVNEKSAQTVQLQGIIEIINNPAERFELIKQFTQPRQYDDDVLLPPITTIHEDAYIALRITPLSAHYTDYKARLKAER